VDDRAVLNVYPGADPNRAHVPTHDAAEPDTALCDDFRVAHHGSIWCNPGVIRNRRSNAADSIPTEEIMLASSRDFRGSRMKISRGMVRESVAAESYCCSNRKQTAFAYPEWTTMGVG